jgi:hypothetical protein
MAMADPLEVLTAMFEAPCLLPMQVRTLWTQPCKVRPALSATRHGAGDLLIGLSPVMHRPSYYLVWIDRKWWPERYGYATDEFRDKLDDIWLALEDEFGRRDSDDTGPYKWPEVDDDGGCSWWWADADCILTARQRKRLIPSFDNTWDREFPRLPLDGEQGGGG